MNILLHTWFLIKVQTVFWCNTCPVVKKYDERLVKLNEEFAGKGFPVIAINSNDKGVSPGDSYEEMQKTAAAKNYAFQYLYNESQDVARKYGAVIKNCILRTLRISLIGKMLIKCLQSVLHLKYYPSLCGLTSDSALSQTVQHEN